MRDGPWVFSCSYAVLEMNNTRFEGMARTRIAMICAAESGVGFPTAHGVLHQGHPVKSLASVRAARWAEENGITLPGVKRQAPEPKVRPIKSTKIALDELEAGIAAAERKARGQ